MAGGSVGTVKYSLKLHTLFIADALHLFMLKGKMKLKFEEIKK